MWAGGDPLTLLPAVAREIHAVDPSAPLADVSTLAGRLAAAMRGETFRASLLGTLAALALSLAALGAYSVTSFAVSRWRGLGSDSRCYVVVPLLIVPIVWTAAGARH